LVENEGTSLVELDRRLAMTRHGVMKHLRTRGEARLVTTARTGRRKLHFLQPAALALAQAELARLHPEQPAAER